MNRRDILTSGAVLMAAGAANAGDPAPNDNRTVVKNLLTKQAAQWTAGDLEKFCANYADDAIFLSPTGMTKGRQAVYDRYKKKYGTDKSTMGALSFEVLGAIADSAAASIAMKWKLTYKDKPEASGFSVIGLERRGDVWLVVHDASM